jgi:photoactive yellow protein
MRPRPDGGGIGLTKYTPSPDRGAATRKGNSMQQLEFDQPGMAALLAALDDSTLDSLGFGVIGFDADGKVQRYNRFESQAAGLGVERVLQQDLFLVVAPCMNNFLVAQRFIEARDAGVALDETIPYVLTLRMRPTKVRLRLLSAPQDALAYVLVQRL